MGYYTNYSLEADKEPPTAPTPEPLRCRCGNQRTTRFCPECVVKIEGFVKPDTWEEIISSRVGRCFTFDEEIKWYDHRKDMLKLSLEFPDVLFTLSGAGEEPGDLWKLEGVLPPG